MTITVIKYDTLNSKLRITSHFSRKIKLKRQKRIHSIHEHNTSSRRLYNHKDIIHSSSFLSIRSYSISNELPITLHPNHEINISVHDFQEPCTSSSFLLPWGQPEQSKIRKDPRRWQPLTYFLKPLSLCHFSPVLPKFLIFFRVWEGELGMKKWDDKWSHQEDQWEDEEA